MENNLTADPIYYEGGGEEAINDIKIANEKMHEMLSKDLGINIFIDGATKEVDVVDLRMDKSVFDSYWRIREKAFEKLIEIAKNYNQIKQNYNENNND